MCTTNERYRILRGEQGIEVASASTIREAEDLVEVFDQELTSDEWDNLENHWIYDTWEDQEDMEDRV